MKPTKNRSEFCLTPILDKFVADISLATMYKRLFIIIAFFIINHWLYSQITPAKNPALYKTIISESFGSDKIPKTLEAGSDGQWLISKGGKSGKTLKYIGNTQPNGSDVRPVTKAFVRGISFKSFIFEADIEQCGRDYDCRDVCIIFNHIDDNNYNFVHLASVAGEFCHGIFQVKDAMLSMISPESEEPINWGVKQWFQVRIEMGLEPGKLLVFVNNSLLWELNEFEHGSGRIGFGAVDGSAKIDNLKIFAPETEIVDALY